MDSSGKPPSFATGDSLRGVDSELRLITELSDAVRKNGDAKAAAELIHLRHKVCLTGQHPPPPEHWPPTVSTNVGGTEIPTVSPGELTVEVLKDAISRQSCLLVPGLMPERDVDDIVAGIDRALDAIARRKAGDTDPSLESWFLPYVPEGAKDAYAEVRHWANMCGTVFAADSPQNFQRFVDTCNSMGVFDLLTEYFGVRPVMSVPKTTLKRVTPDTPIGWHQDIRAYGENTRALNMWVALSPCGKDARGLGVVPINPGGPVEDTPPPPPLVPISDETISRLAVEGTPAHEPLFEKGDVLFFDTVLPHTTQQGDIAKFTKNRYAMECWFFSPTTLEDIWLPLHV
ncbi:Uncharacterised protein [Halioglobus japonicus]|nr:Uncharacterised protein [Halioglobus japonicus]